MPPIGMLIGGIDFSDFFVPLTLSGETYATLAAAKAAGVATLNYGAFINVIIQFTIVAFALFMLIKQVNRFAPKKDEAAAGPPRQEVLLEQIRDLLAKK